MTAVPRPDEPRPLMCVGCGRVLTAGDRYIEDAASGFLGIPQDETEANIDGLIADIFGGAGDSVVFCESCTEPGGEYVFRVYEGGSAA